MQLHSEGLVVLERMKGFRVASISIEHLQDLARVRIEMEGTAIRWSIEYGDVDWEADILGAFHRLSKRKKMHDEMNSGIDPYWRDAHRAFHTALMAACRSPLLISICDSLFDQAERYVALSIRHIDQPRNDIGEHEGIMHAALARDARSAIELTQQHIGRTAEKVAAASAMFSEKAG